MMVTITKKLNNEITIRGMNHHGWYRNVTTRDGICMDVAMNTSCFSTGVYLSSAVAVQPGNIVCAKTSLPLMGRVKLTVTLFWENDTCSIGAGARRSLDSASQKIGNAVLRS